VYVTHDQVEAMTMAHRIAVLRDGLLQQVDTPENLYDRPANVFVAGFMGSPAMNFFDARLVRDNGQLYADTGLFRVPVPPEQGTNLAASQDSVIVGIRPEDIYDAAYLPPGIAPLLLQGEVEVAELSGARRCHGGAGHRPGTSTFLRQAEPTSHQGRWAGVSA
jgi:multiple sugar transport system ATP-binding protein